MSQILQQQAAENQAYWICPKTGIEMAVIPAGGFFYGEKAGYPLETSTYSVARHPVTNAQWAHFLNETNYTPDSNQPRPETYLQHWIDQKDPPESLLEHPVTWISYCAAFRQMGWFKNPFRMVVGKSRPRNRRKRVPMGIPSQQVFRKCCPRHPRDNRKGRCLPQNTDRFRM